MPSLHREFGYTLLELLVVMAIVGILAYAGVGLMINRPSVAVRGVTNDFYGMLRAAQTLARNSGRRVALQTQGTQPAGSLVFQYGFYAQLADGSDDMTKGPGATLANPVVGSFSLDSSLSRFAHIGDAVTGQFDQILPNPSPSTDVTLAKLQGAAFWSSSANNLFRGGGTAAADVFFQPDGTPSRDFYVPIVGVTGGAVSSDLSVGIILSSQTNGLLAFQKSQSNDPAKPWSRL